MARYKSVHTGPQIDSGVARALPGGEIDLSLSNKANGPHEIAQAGSLNDYTTPGDFYCPWNSFAAQMQNMPPGLSDAFALRVELGVSGEPVQCYRSGFNQLTYTRFKSYYNTTSGWVDTWSPWVQIATSTPPTEYDLPLAGVTGTLKYSKSQDSKVLIPSICVTAAASLSAGATIATLPASYYPSAEKKALADIGGTLGRVIISTAGVITISKAAASGAEICTGSIAFVAAS